MLAIALFIGLIFAVKFKDKIYAKVPVFGRIAAFATKERKGSSDKNSDKAKDISPTPEDESRFSLCKITINTKFYAIDYQSF